MEPSYEALKERVEQLEETVQECERLTVANRYAAAIMHEVNNPLEALTNLAYLMRQEELSDTVSGHLALMEDQITVLTAVTRPTLAFHKDNRGAQSIDVVPLISSVKKLHEGRLLSAGLKLETRNPEAAHCEVVGSELLQVLSNLLLNAMDPMTEACCGSTINIRVHRCADTISLLVADDGPGIPAHVEKKLCEPYSTGKATGTGLGLWISKRIVEGHRGRLRWRSSRRSGRSGTAFRIVLPCAASSAVASVA